MSDKKDEEFEKLIKNLKKQDPHFVQNITNESKQAGHKPVNKPATSKSNLVFGLILVAFITFGMGWPLITLLLTAAAVALGTLDKATKFDMEERYEKRQRQLGR